MVRHPSLALSSALNAASASSLSPCLRNWPRVNKAVQSSLWPGKVIEAQRGICLGLVLLRCNTGTYNGYCLCYGTCKKRTKFCRFAALVIRSSSAEYSKDICKIVKGIRGILEGHLRNGRRNPWNRRRASAEW